MENLEKKAMTLLVERLFAIANGDIRPFFKVREYAKSAIEDADSLLHPERQIIHLETDADLTTKEFVIAKDLIGRFAKNQNDVELIEEGRYERKQTQITYITYKITLKDTADTASAIDWLDARNATFFSDEKGVHMFFAIPAKIGTETAYLTTNKKRGQK